MIRELRGLTYLATLTFRRQVFARKSIVAVVLIALLTLAVFAWAYRRVPDIQREAERAMAQKVLIQEEGRQARRANPDALTRAKEQYADQITPLATDEANRRILIEFGDNIIMGIFVSFMLPLLCLIFATSAIGDERDDRTIVYLLTRPLSRWRMYLAKGVGVVPIIIVIVTGAFGLLCLAAGEPGAMVWGRFLPGLVLGSLTYTSLFLLFGALAPRPLITSVFYSFLVETLIGNMPGTLKRLAISFHTNCVLFGAGADVGIAPENPGHFVPIAGETAAMVLWIALATLLLWGAYAFHRREYRDLS